MKITNLHCSGITHGMVGEFTLRNSRNYFKLCDILIGYIGLEGVFIYKSV
jgi:hypothetical protein